MFFLKKRSIIYSNYSISCSIFRNKSSSNLPNNIERNRPFRSFDSFWIVSLIRCNNKQEFSRDLNIFMVPLFEIINNVVPEPKTFLCILASASDVVMLLLVMWIVRKHFHLIFEEHFPLPVKSVLPMDQEVYQEIHLYFI